MNTALEHLKSARAQIAALEKIAKDCDPASGVSFSVRRGVARDNEDSEGDCVRRPWVTVETSDLPVAKGLIEIIISAARRNEAFWLKALQADIRDACAYLASEKEGAK